LKQRKINKILSRARAAPEPIVLSLDSVGRPRKTAVLQPDQESGASLSTQLMPSIMEEAHPGDPSVRTAEPDSPSPPAQAPVPPDVDLMRQQAQRLLADAQGQAMRLQQETQARTMDAQKALLDAQSKAQSAIAEAQAQAQRLLGDAQAQLQRVQQEVDSQIRTQREQRLREMESELAQIRKTAEEEGREQGRAEGFQAGRAEAMAAVNLGAGDIIERLRGILEATQQAKMQELERNVDIDSEMARMAENSHEYAVMIRLVSDRFSGLRSAIIGR
jgi:hypothetical protein